MKPNLFLLRGVLLIITILVCFSCKKEPKNDNPTVPENGYGQVNFAIDHTLTSTVDIGEQPQSISVTDKNNVIWTLDMPVQPYSEPISVSMTPIGNFQKSVSSCKPFSGVVFGPDSYYFADPATLTVEFPENQKVKPLFYSIKGTGVNDTLDLMAADQSGKKYTLTIYHFSGTMAGEPVNLDKEYKAAKANYDAAIAEAKELSKQPITVIEPPKVPINPCTGTVSRAQEGAINGFIDAICQPEHKILNKILSAQKAMCFMATEVNDPICVASSYTLGLSSRLVKKAQMLITQYGNVDDYMVPVRRAALKIAKQDGILGGESQQQLLNGLVGNIYKVRDNTLKKLRDEHDYKVIPLLFGLTRDYCMLSPDCDQETFIQTIIKAATFKASIITEFKKADNSIVVFTDFKPRFQLNDTYDRFTSTANIDFVEGSIEKAASHAKCGGKWAQLIPFNMPLDADLKIDVCEANDATISFNPIITLPNPLEMQTGSYWYPVPDPGHCETITSNSAWASAAFLSQAGITTMFDFMRGTLQINGKDVNKKAMLIDKTIPVLSGGFNITYTVKLEHTPL